MVENPTKISIYLNKDEKTWLAEKADQNGRSIKKEQNNKDNNFF